MAETKKSFLLYFDMYPQIRELSLEQRGALLSALFQFAESEAREAGSGANLLESAPDMTMETRMAFRFIAETIRRDSEKWHQKHQRYQKAALERHRKQSQLESDMRQYVQALSQAQAAAGKKQPHEENAT